MNYPVPTCPLYNMQDHDTNHLFNCTAIPTTPTSIDAAELIAQWEDRLVGHLMAPH